MSKVFEWAYEGYVWLNSQLDKVPDAGWVLLGMMQWFVRSDDWLTIWLVKLSLGVGVVPQSLYTVVALAFSLANTPIGMAYAPHFDFLLGLIPKIRKALYRAILVIAGVLLILITAAVFGQELHTFWLAAIYAGLAAFLGWVRYGFHVMQNARPIGIRWE